jgi:hypothetical protein
METPVVGHQAHERPKTLATQVVQLVPLAVVKLAVHVGGGGGGGGGKQQVVKLVPFGVVAHLQTPMLSLQTPLPQQSCGHLYVLRTQLHPTMYP